MLIVSSLLPFILSTQVDFSALDMPEPIQFVNQYFVENIQDDFVIYLSALAGVSILKSLMRF